MAERRRVNLKEILGDRDLRRELMVPTIQALQAREGIETSREQAERAYYVVTETDKTAFFDLDRFKGSKNSEGDQREVMFVRALNNELREVRLDVARRDFSAIQGSPLEYQSVGRVSHIFKDSPPLQPAWGTAAQGLATTDDPRWVRYHWEVHLQEVGRDKTWVSFAKGGSFERFYSDIDLVIKWKGDGQELKKEIIKRYGSAGKRIYGQAFYFTKGITWPYRSQRGFGPRILPGTGVHGHVGHSFFPRNECETFYILALMASAPFSYLLSVYSVFGKYEVGMVKLIPCPYSDKISHVLLSSNSQSIYSAKLDWDTGNETSTNFVKPWLLNDELTSLDLSSRLDQLATIEANEEARIQSLYAELNDEAYKSYGISTAHRAEIEATMGERPPEVLWVAMERKDTAQKRMEHVWRLLSYAVKRVVEADEDGIVSFHAMAGEPALIDRVRNELHQLFPQQDPNALEVALTNELKRRAKGYRSVTSLDEWLSNEFFAYHESLYKSRPILWHIASSQGRGDFAFGALVRYHNFDYERLAKLRGTYLRDAIAHCRREAGLASQEGRTDDRLLWQGRQEEAELLDQRLQWIQEGINGPPAPGDCRIRTPWKAEAEQPQGWRPDLDDGVVVNIAPLQIAGVLRTEGGPS